MSHGPMTLGELTDANRDETVGLTVTPRIGAIRRFGRPVAWACRGVPGGEPVEPSRSAHAVRARAKRVVPSGPISGVVVVSPVSGTVDNQFLL